MNQRKNAKIGERRQDLAEKFYRACLLSPKGFDAVMKHRSFKRGLIHSVLISGIRLVRPDQTKSLLRFIEPRFLDEFWKTTMSKDFEPPDNSLAVIRMRPKAHNTRSVFRWKLDFGRRFAFGCAPSFPLRRLHNFRPCDIPTENSPCRRATKSCQREAIAQE